PRRVLPDAGLQHVAHDDFVDVLGIDLAPAQRVLDGVRAERRRLERREATLKAADRSAGVAEDDDVRHGVLLVRAESSGARNGRRSFGRDGATSEASRATVVAAAALLADRPVSPGNESTWRSGRERRRPRERARSRRRTPRSARKPSPSDAEAPNARAEPTARLH